MRISQRGRVPAGNSQQPEAAGVKLAEGDGVGVAEAEGKNVGDAVFVVVAVAVADALDVGLHVGVRVKVGERVNVEVEEGLRVGVNDAVGVEDGVGVCVRVGEKVGELVGVAEGVTVRVTVGVRVRVRVEVTVGVKGTPVPLKTKWPLAVDFPATTRTTLWPTDKATRTRDRPEPPSAVVMSSLHASSGPEHVPRRTESKVSNSDPSVLNSNVPENGAV